MRAQRVQHDVQLVAPTRHLWRLRPLNGHTHIAGKVERVLAIALAHRSPERRPHGCLLLSHIRRSTGGAKLGKHVIVNLHIRRARKAVILKLSGAAVKLLFHDVAHAVIELSRLSHRHLAGVKHRVFAEPHGVIGSADPRCIVGNRHSHVTAAGQLLSKVGRINAPRAQCLIIQRRVLGLKILLQPLSRHIECLVIHVGRLQRLKEFIDRPSPHLGFRGDPINLSNDRGRFAAARVPRKHVQHAAPANADNLDRRRCQFGQTLNHDLAPVQLPRCCKLSRCLAAGAQDNLSDALHNHVARGVFEQGLARHAARNSVKHGDYQAALDTQALGLSHQFAVLQHKRSGLRRRHVHPALLQELHGRVGVFYEE